MPCSANVADVPRTLFAGIATSYDWPAQVFSLLQYRRWHRLLLSRLQLSPPARVLDMATGTGAVALQLAQRPGIEVAACDITRPMLVRPRHGHAATGNGGPRYTRVLNPGWISLKSASSSSAWATITAIARPQRMSPSAIGMSHNRRTCILVASLYRLSIEQRALYEF